MDSGGEKNIEWMALDSADVVASTVLEMISDAAIQAIAERGHFSLVLAGGTTPQKVYRRLASSEQVWARWALYYGDERCLPVGDDERNSTMVERSGLAARVVQHYPIPAELGAETGAAQYEPVVAAALPFDMVLLGMGEDGHTASLFPGHDHDLPRLVIPVHDAPKPPPDRISLTPGALKRCREMIVMVTGSSKAAALQGWQEGRKLPVAEVVDATENVKVVTDLNLSNSG
jgi:6-phosphogluconolactonase